MAGRVRPGGMMYMWTHFKNSLLRRKDTRIKMGDDYLGNIYFEQQIKSREDRSRVVRSYESRKEETWEEVPPEWEAWLRNKRPDPPSREEIHANIQMMKQKQENARKLEAKRTRELTAGDSQLENAETADPTATVSFPKYDEYNDERQNPGLKGGVPTRDHTIR